MSPALPLESFPLILTQNADEMCAALARVYAKPELFLEGRTNRVDAAVNRYQAKDVAIGYADYGVCMTAVYPENNFALQIMPVRGLGEVAISNIRSPLRPHHSVVVSPGVSFAVKLNANYRHFVLVIKARTLADKLSALIGTTVNSPLSFNAVPDDGCPAAKALRDHFFFLVDALSMSAVPLSKFVLAEFEQALMIMFLCANQHNYSHRLQREAPDIAPVQVRRAEEFIEANWQRAITLEDLVTAAGVSALALSRAFKKYRGCSPLEFLSQLRSIRGQTLG
jgi:AraC-binding-like domain/Bacterial regulatory helix-turn-helix proteins, AraC family